MSRSRSFICYGAHRHPELGNPDWRTGTWGILGVFRHHGHVAAFFWCMSKFKDMLKDTGLFKSTKSVPMAGLYGHFLEYPDWRTTACITMGYRPLTDHQNELQSEDYSGPQLTTIN